MLVKMEVMESFERTSFSTEGRESIIFRFIIATGSSDLYMRGGRGLSLASASASATYSSGLQSPARNAWLTPPTHPQNLLKKSRFRRKNHSFVNFLCVSLFFKLSFFLK